ncbi:MAG: DsrE family protein [Gammaproteobacteria bacterium]|nr:DsrE family protein [Gammaproteobacteria bacterium]
MRLGIVVTDERQANSAFEFLKSALALDWTVRCFLTDDGVNLIKNAEFITVARDDRVHLSACEHSIARCCDDFDLTGVEDAVIVGGQYQDAELVRNSDRVLVF